MKNIKLLSMCIFLFPTINLFAGTISFWKFNEGTGLSVLDSMGTNTGTINGSPSWITGRTGLSTDYGLSFNANGYIDIGNKISLIRGLVNNKEFSISVWLRTTDASSTRTYLMKELNSSDNFVLDISLNFCADPWGVAAGHTMFYLRDTTGKILAGSIGPESGIYDGNWHNIIFSVKADTNIINIYVDTVPQTVIMEYAQSPTSFSNLQYPLIVGAQNNRGTVDYILFKGDIDELSIFDKLLSSQEIADIYQGNIHQANITISILPSDAGINTLSPLPGAYVYDSNTPLKLSALPYINCPVQYVFDHWEGDVADNNSAITSTIPNVDKTITAVFRAMPADCNIPVSTGLSAWFNASNPATIVPNNGSVSDGCKVAVLADTLAGDNTETDNAIQSVSYKQPIWVSTVEGLRGKPAVLFSAPPACLDVNSLTIGSAATIFDVVQNAVQNSTENKVNHWILAGDANSVVLGNGYAIGLSDANSSPTSFKAALGNGATMEYAATTNPQDTSFKVIAFRRNDAQSNNVEIYINGILGTTETFTRSTGFHTGYTIGGDPINPVRSYKGLIPEIIIYDRALNNSEMISVNNYLINKYLTKQCGDPGTAYSTADLNKDCVTNFKDYAVFAADWLQSIE
jgi:hypothetical protein